MSNYIPFNKPYLTGKETEYIKLAVESGKISGNGVYTQKCQEFFEKKYGFKKCLLTSSCTDALEMAAILCDIKPGDEVIIPSYTFVSTANAFVLRGARIVFADSRKDHPGMDEDKIEKLITEKTKAIVPVHYAGFACDMDKIMKIASKHNLFVVEDAAQAIENYFIDSNGNKKPLGGIGHFSAFSFHETKNIISGEGGMLVINDERFIKRAEIIWEKGTNRASFFRGEVDKYSWVDIGSSFLPSEIVSAFLYAQLESIDQIQKKRKLIWEKYYTDLKELEKTGFLRLPINLTYSTCNAHMFYVVCRNLKERTALIKELKKNGVLAVFHYLSLHNSEFNKSINSNFNELKNSDFFSDHLLRLPLYYELNDTQLDFIINSIKNFFSNFQKTK